MLQAINLEALTRSVPVDANERSDRERIVMQISLHESTDHCCWTWRDAAEFLGPAPLAQAA
jgi:hypothetical protein